jgi:hypothetical protein
MRSISILGKRIKRGLILTLFLCVLAKSVAMEVTITRKTPLAIVSADGAMTGVKEAVVGTKLTWVKTEGSQVTLEDAQGIYYRIAVAATDYTPPTPAPAPTAAAVSSPSNNTTLTTASAESAQPSPPSTPAVSPGVTTRQSQDYAANTTTPDFGPNVILFDPSMNNADIESKCAAVFDKQERNEFGMERYAFMFKPGTYQARINVGFYTQIYGLGKLPDDTTITGEIKSSGAWDNGNGTRNFWRGCENLAIVPIGKNNTWAVSQAAPFRRVHVKGSLWLFEGGWTSGGFMADCKIDDRVVSGSQQQWFSRNTDWGEWDGGVWNMVFMGIPSPPIGTWPDRPYTIIDKTPCIREKPFLYLDSGGKYAVFVPGLRRDSSSYSWGDGSPLGESISLTQFYVARADKDSAATLNAALVQGKNLLLTPGIYHLDDTLKVTRPDTVVLGLGMATLSPEKGTSAMEISDVNGVKIANILFDAGPVTSPVLLQVGEAGSSQSHTDDPTILFDVFCRVGGAAVGVTKTCVVINSNDVIGDHAWIWRADHGAGSAWNENKSTNGLIVNGRNVTYYGLFVEHFQENQTLWNGENGRVYFYQCEMPYDPPTQDDWKHGSAKGYPGYKVADTVKKHEAWGLGIYCVFKQDNIYADTAVEAPTSPDIHFHHVLTFRLSGETEESGIKSVINGTGAPATKTTTKQMVLEYPDAG